jgi:formylglycine-generating enzyme required for sulfatase activity
MAKLLISIFVLFCIGADVELRATQSENMNIDKINNMVYISGGTFMMGSSIEDRWHMSNELPQRRITVSSFYISKYPVTQAEFEEVMGRNPSGFRGANLPVEQVSWFDAIEYCNRLSLNKGLTPAYTIRGSTVIWNREANGYRLPTEAEWEFACRAGTQTPFSSGTSMNTVGWHSGNSGGRTRPVGEREPNAWGLYDMHGNVLEWCWDWLGDYTNAEETDPIGPLTGTRRVYRGGSWRFDALQARSAFRFGNHPHLRQNFIGFRVAKNANEKENGL